MREIPLVHSKLTAKVDDEDYPKLSHRRWYWYWYNRTNYAKTFINGKSISMQAFIYPPPDGFLVDHRNGDGLDNQKYNLRHATLQEQRQNTRKHEDSSSDYKGVSWSKERRKWVAQICINGKQTSLGRFHNEIDAAKAYDAAAKEHFKEFAILNFP